MTRQATPTGSVRYACKTINHPNGAFYGLQLRNQKMNRNNKETPLKDLLTEAVHADPRKHRFIYRYEDKIRSMGRISVG